MGNVDLMRIIAVILFCFCLLFAFGCRNASVTDITDTTTVRSVESIEGLEMVDGTYPVTLPLDPEVEQSIYEASVSEEESLNEESARWDAVDEVMAAVLNSKEFTEAATDEQKAETVINAMKELSEHGTGKYPESLIIYDSWIYVPEYKEVNAKYFDGVEFSVSWFDFNRDSGSTVMTE